MLSLWRSRTRILPRADADGHSRLDVRGMLLLSPGLALLIFGLSEVGIAGRFATHAC